MSQRRKQQILQQLSNIQTEASSLARRATQLEHETSKIIQELQDLEFSTHHGYLSGDKVEVTNDYKGEREKSTPFLHQNLSRQKILVHLIQ